MLVLYHINLIIHAFTSLIPLVDGCARQKGGALVSYIYMHTNHRDPSRHEFAVNAFDFIPTIVLFVIYDQIKCSLVYIILCHSNIYLLWFLPHQSE